MSDKKTRKREIEAFEVLDSEDRYKHYFVTYGENSIEKNVNIESFDEFSLSK